MNRARTPPAADCNAARHHHHRSASDIPTAHLADLKQKVTFACSAVSGALKFVTASLEHQLTAVFGWEFSRGTDQLSIQLKGAGHALRGALNVGVLCLFGRLLELWSAMLSA